MIFHFSVPLSQLSRYNVGPSKKTLIYLSNYKKVYNIIGTVGHISLTVWFIRVIRCPSCNIVLRQWGQLAISILDFKPISPLRIQKSAVHEPTLEFQQLCTHFAPLLHSTLRLCAFGFCSSTMLDFRRSETRKAFLGPWSCWVATMESTPPYR